MAPDAPAIALLAERALTLANENQSSLVCIVYVTQVLRDSNIRRYLPVSPEAVGVIKLPDLLSYTSELPAPMKFACDYSSEFERGTRIPVQHRSCPISARTWALFWFQEPRQDPKLAHSV